LSPGFLLINKSKPRGGSPQYIGMWTLFNK